MISYLRSTHYKPIIKPHSDLQPGSWVRSERPNEDEQAQLVKLGIDEDLLVDALTRMRFLVLSLKMAGLTL